MDAATRKQQHMPMRWQNKTEQDLSKTTLFWDVTPRNVASSGQLSRNLLPPASGIPLQGLYLNMDVARSFEM
jgi:hypothetical protein